MNAIRQVNPMHGMALLAMAAIVSTLPATAQDSLPRSVSTSQSVSMGPAPQGYGVLHVNVVTGSDQQGAGSAERPFKTITQALRKAPTTSTVILLAPGHYSQDSGEQFPLRLRPGITIQGNSGETRNTLIVGGGEFQVGNGTQNTTIVTADRSGLANILVSNANGSGVWITAGSPILRRVALVSNAVAGVQVTDSAPVIENSYFHGNQYGLTIQGDGHALIRGNYFEETGRAITVTSPATPTINNNRIARNQVGIVLKNNARPLVNANALVSNDRNGVVEVESTRATAPTPTNQSEVEPHGAPGNISADRGQEPPAVLIQPEAVVTDGLTEPVNTEPVVNTNEPDDDAHQVASEVISGEDTATGAIASFRAHLARERPAVLSAPAPVSAAQAAPLDSPQTSSSPNLDEAVPHTADNAVMNDTQTIAEDGIPIAVIPASEPETTPNNSANNENERREGISKLLARLNRNRESALSPSENTVAVTTPTVSVPDIPTPDVPTFDEPTANQRLPVPSVTIPSGSSSINLTPPGTMALTKTFRYRVLVDMADAEDLENLVPDAFRTQVGSRMFMQAGAYVDEAEAQDRLEWLQENGIEGQINLRN